MERIKTLFQKFFDSYYENLFIASIGPFLILISFSFPVGSAIRYGLVLLSFGLSCCYAFRVRVRYGKETHKQSYPFVSFVSLALLLIFLLTRVVYYFILIAAGIVFLFDLVRCYIMEKRMTAEEKDDDDLGHFKKP